MNKDQVEIKNRLVAAGIMPERNYFKKPYIAESKAVFIDYCESVLAVSKDTVVSVVKAHFKEEVKAWNSFAAMDALVAVYESVVGPLNKKLIETTWAVPEVCPLCGFKTRVSAFNIVSDPYHKAFACFDNDKMVARDHFTWPVLHRINKKGDKQ